MRDNEGGDRPRLKPTPSNDDLSKKIAVQENWIDLIFSRYWWVFATAFIVAFAVSIAILYFIISNLQSDIRCLRSELRQDINRQIDLLRVR